jgi:hypothetical protein
MAISRRRENKALPPNLPTTQRSPGQSGFSFDSTILKLDTHLHIGMTETIPKPPGRGVRMSEIARGSKKGQIRCIMRSPYLLLGKTRRLHNARLFNHLNDLPSGIKP